MNYLFKHRQTRENSVALRVFWVIVGLGFLSWGTFMTMPGADAVTLKSTIEETVVQSPGIIGMNMQVNQNQYPIILEVYPGTPAFKAGIQPGDELIAVNQTSTMGLTRLALDQLIPDTPGMTIQFLTTRAGQVRPVRLTIVTLDSLALPYQQQFLSNP